MASLIDLNRKIAKLQKQADAIKNREKKGVIERIRQAIIQYDLTPAELFSEVPARRGRRPSVASTDALSAQAAARPRRGRPMGAVSRKPVPIRYRDEAGNTWTGRGKTPNWLKEHLENGRRSEEFMVHEDDES
ncbi:MAG: H-NS histone family protein [Lautropia sp.]|nr:H-NS histone family protein [Lautropia sp.]